MTVETERKPFSVIGQRHVRKDGDGKVTGEAQFVADVVLPGMLHGKIIRSPYAHARIRSIDISKAMAVPGVRAVLHAGNCPRPIRPWGAFIPDMRAFAQDKVRYVGEEVAAVAATTPEIAEAAAELVEIEYEPLPAVFDVEEAFAEGAPLLYEDRESNVAMSIDVERGDVEAAFARSAVIVEGKFESMHQWHSAIETIGSVAEWSRSGKLTLYMNTQTLFMARYRISVALGMKEGDIRIIQPYVGGGFGGKSCDDNNAIVCALLALQTGRPVKTINSREDEFQAGSRPRVPMRIYGKLGLDKDGYITAKALKIFSDNGAYSGKAPAITGVAALRHDTCYKYKDVKVQAYLMYTNKIPTGAFRGFGNPSAEWAVEQLLDMAAHKLGMDPLDVARKNAAEPGYVSPHGNRVTSCELKQCIDHVEELMDWKNARASKKPDHGFGFGCTVHVSGKRHFGDYDGGSATIKLNEDGKAIIWSGEGECGQGPQTVLPQIVAEELGLPMDMVEMSMADTDLTTWSQGAYASRITYVSGNAVRNAAQNLKKVIFERAAELLECNPEDLDVGDGKVFVKGDPDNALTMREVARGSLYREQGMPIVASGHFDPDSQLQDHETRWGNESGAYNYAAQACEVHVDRETGQVKVLTYCSVSDCGTVINPVAAEGQVEGSVAQGLGYALTEGASIMFDDGKPVALNFHDYKLPAMGDMPELRQRFADSWEPTGPFGAKGLGELGMDPAAAVISNAIYDAVGVRITRLPITPEKVLYALREKERTGQDTFFI